MRAAGAAVTLKGVRALGRIGAGLGALLVALVFAGAIVGGVVGTDADLIHSGGWWYLVLILAWPLVVAAWVYWDRHHF